MLIVHVREWSIQLLSIVLRHDRVVDSSLSVCLLPILKGAPTVEGRPGETMPPLDLDALKAELTERHGEHIDDKDVISAALYPKVFEDFENFRDSYGPVDKLDTKTFLLGPDIGQDIEVRRANKQ